MTDSNNKNKKTVVDSETDKRINSIALALTFLAIGLILLFIPDFLGDSTITLICRWAFIGIGIAGFLVSFGDKDSKVKGSDDIGAGLLVSALAVLVFLYIPRPFGGIAAILVGVLGLFGLIRGILFVCVTTLRGRMKSGSDSAKQSFAIDVLKLLSEVAGLALVVAQLVLLLTGPTQ